MMPKQHRAHHHGNVWAWAFQIAQLLVLALFIVIGVAAVVRFRIGPGNTIAPPLRSQPVAS